MARGNLTLSAAPELIYRARVNVVNTVKNYRSLMKNFAHIKSGRRFNRDEMNER